MRSPLTQSTGRRPSACPGRLALALAAGALAALAAGCTPTGSEPSVPRTPREVAVPDYLQDTVGEIARFAGREPLIVQGYGFVTGLDGTGTTTVPPGIRRRVLDMMRRNKVEHAEEVLAENGLSKSDIPYLIGTMIEVPRAAVTADEIATEAEFFSFGTNDLTQMGCGFSRDDAGRFLKEYVEKGIYDADPFQVLDQDGVGRLIKMACELGRKARPDIHLGICGEHGGEPRSIAFCHKVGLDYVSCSPYRVPIARLAAAQAAVRED